MPHKIWMLDIAREQSPTLDNLYEYASRAQNYGYNALGLYLEHRFAFDATPWSHGRGCVTKEMIHNLESEFPSLEIIPFINLLGHFEGFIYTEGGKKYKEDLFKGLQACPSCPEFVKLCQTLVEETLSTFSSNIIHLGGDETYQLGNCPACKANFSEADPDPKATLYKQHFLPLIQQVIDADKTPALWGDMFLDHPTALEGIPKETLLFDWQYMNGLKETSPKFKDYKVYGCPTLHVYNAPWMHIKGSEENIKQVAQDVQELNLHGFCLTTWEPALFGCFDTQWPAIKFASDIADNPSSEKTILNSYQDESESHETWAKYVGIDLEELGGVFGYSKLRNPLKCRLLLYGNPFLAWMHHAEQLSGKDGETALKILDQALHIAPTEAEKNATIFIRGAIEFVRMAEEARILYAKQDADAAIGKLAPTRYLFDTLENTAKQNSARAGGSKADIERCKKAKHHVETVIKRIRDYGRGELGYLPAFEVITNPRFTPHDQGCWWLVNKWANE